MATPTTVRRVLSANLLSAARKQGKSVVALADFAEVSAAHLYDVIAGRKSASIDFVARVADALKLEPWQLLRPSDLGEVDERPPRRRARR